MTAREWMVANRPKDVIEHCMGGVRGCPDDYGLNVNIPSDCDNTECSDCWNQEIRVNNEKEKNTVNSKKTKNQLLAEIADLKNELAKLENYRKYEQAADEIRAVMEAFLNSGFSREEAFALVMKLFETACHR